MAVCEVCGNDYDKSFEVTAAGPGSKGAIERDKPRHRMEPHMSNDLSLAQNHCPDTDGPGYPL